MYHTAKPKRSELSAERQKVRIVVFAVIKKTMIYSAEKALTERCGQISSFGKRQAYFFGEKPGSNRFGVGMNRDAADAQSMTGMSFGGKTIISKSTVASGFFRV